MPRLGLLPSDARTGIELLLSTFSDKSRVNTVPASALVRHGSLSRWHGTNREENQVSSYISGNATDQTDFLRIIQINRVKRNLK